MRTFFLLTAIYLHAASASAETIRIFYRHNIYSLMADDRANIEKLKGVDLRLASPEVLGHVAMEFPNLLGGTSVIGWRPSDEGIRMFGGASNLLLHFLQENDSFVRGHVNGSFVDERPWLSDPGSHPLFQVYEIELDVSEMQIKILYSAIENIVRAGRYQLVPNGDRESLKFPEDHYNCVTAIGKLMKAIGVEDIFFPLDGSISAFIRANRGKAHPRVSCSDGFGTSLFRNREF